MQYLVICNANCMKMLLLFYDCLLQVAQIPLASTVALVKHALGLARLTTQTSTVCALLVSLVKIVLNKLTVVS